MLVGVLLAAAVLVLVLLLALPIDGESTVTRRRSKARRAREVFVQEVRDMRRGTFLAYLAFAAMFVFAASVFRAVANVERPVAEAVRVGLYVSVVIVLLLLAARRRW